MFHTTLDYAVNWLRERHLFYVHGIESKHHRIADATPPRAHSVHVSIAQEYTEPPQEHSMMEHRGRGIGGRGLEEGERTGCRGWRVRDREMGFHIMRSHVSSGFLSAVTPFRVAFGGPPEQNVRPKNTHWGKKRSAITLHYSFRFRCIFDRKCKRARQRGDGTKPTLGSEKVRWGVWRGNLWVDLTDLCDVFILQRSDPHGQLEVATTGPGVYVV
jgi:hypothetical protein